MAAITEYCRIFGRLTTSIVTVTVKPLTNDEMFVVGNKVPRVLHQITQVLLDEILMSVQIQHPISTLARLVMVQNSPISKGTDGQSVVASSMNQG